MNISQEAVKRGQSFKPTSDMIRAAETVFRCMAMVQTIKPIVKGYQQKILDYEKYEYSEKHQNRRGMERTDWIKDPNLTYLMNDSDFKHYLKRCNEERIKAKLHVEKEEYCPLLVAEHMLVLAQNALIDIMEPVTTIKRDQVYNMEHRDKLIDLTLKLLAPYVSKKY